MLEFQPQPTPQAGTVALRLAQQQARWGPDRALHSGPCLGVSHQLRPRQLGLQVAVGTSWGVVSAGEAAGAFPYQWGPLTRGRPWALSPCFHRGDWPGAPTTSHSPSPKPETPSTPCPQRPRLWSPSLAIRSTRVRSAWRLAPLAPWAPPPRTLNLGGGGGGPVRTGPSPAPAVLPSSMSVRHPAGHPWTLVLPPPPHSLPSSPTPPGAELSEAGGPCVRNATFLGAGPRALWVTPYGGFALTLSCVSPPTAARAPHLSPWVETVGFLQTVSQLPRAWWTMGNGEPLVWAILSTAGWTQAMPPVGSGTSLPPPHPCR